MKRIFDKLTYYMDVDVMIRSVKDYLHVPVHKIRKIHTSFDLFYVLMDAGLMSASNREGLARWLRSMAGEDFSYSLLAFEGESNVLPQKEGVVFKLARIRQVIIGHFRVAVNLIMKVRVIAKFCM